MFLQLTTLVISVFWFVYHTNHDFDINDIKRTFYSLFAERNEEYFWFEIFVVSPLLITLPLLPITCPLLWVLLHAIGEAKSLATCVMNEKVYSPSPDGLVQSPSTTYTLYDIFYDNCDDKDQKITWLKLFPKVLFGDKRLFSRNADTFDTLGSLTTLCCVNKEGVLSWYDPAPEKVCFLSRTKTKPTKLDNKEDINSANDASSLSSKQVSTCENVPEANLEIITLSQDAHNSNKLQFDDPDWSRHLSSLKIIGLNILATCAMQQIKDDNDEDPISVLIDSYRGICHPSMEKQLKKFYHSDDGAIKLRECGDTLDQHLTELEYISIEKECLSPGIFLSRSGLSGLAGLTGFDEEISLLYLPKAVLTSYKKHSHLTRAMNRNSLCESGSQLPDAFHANSFLSYAHGVVVSSWEASDQDHLLVFGSGDLVMQLSSHYWDGSDVRSLSELNVRKIMDFYSRNMIVGNCIAFSFRPLDDQFKSNESFVEEMSGIDSSIPSNQIFLGMVSMQYQARIDVFHLIEALENACIRFVHFSSEDEFRAKVFAEKMGLEVGWNCHISLSQKDNDERRQSSNNSVASSTENIPSDSEMEVDNAEYEDPTSPILPQHPSTSPTSESSFSDSAFRVLNRAKLPRGVENIRPHIENVDNVPLLVPLFTDCQQKSTRKMIEIMQSYDEVVCCIGSSDHITNMTVFAQADVSIGLCPVLPFQSRDHISSSFSFQQSPNLALNRRTPIIPTDSADTPNLDRTTPCDNKVVLMARALNTILCSVSLSGGDSLAVIYNMIKQAREFLFLTHVSVILYMKCLLMIALAQLLSHFVSLPPLFNPLDVIWLAYFVIPCVSFSILGSPPDPDSMVWASLKSTSRQVSFLQLLKKNLKHFSRKFLPSCLIVITLYCFCLVSSCMLVAENINQYNRNNSVSNVSTSVSCFPRFIVLITNSTTQHRDSYIAYMGRQKRLSQQLCLCALVLYICVISSGYVHRWKLLINCSPLSNKLWMVSVSFVLAVQAIYSSVVISTYNHVILFETDFSFGSFQPWIWVIFFVWPLPCVLWNEAAKWNEIRMWTRTQKRARLAFGTKLGMNSPF